MTRSERREIIWEPLGWALGIMVVVGGSFSALTILAVKLLGKVCTF